MNDRTMIPMACVKCGKAVGALDCPIEWRSLGDWLEERNIVPLCPCCFDMMKIVHWEDVPNK